MTSSRLPVALVLILAGCNSGAASQDSTPPPPGSDAKVDHTVKVDGAHPPEASQGRERGPDGPAGVKKVTVVFASDIAEANRTAHPHAIAALISGHSPAVSAVLLGGDNARWLGVLTPLTSLLAFYTTYYQAAAEANWGQFDAIAFPQTGNHEYSFALTETGGQGYFDYFKTRMAAIKALPGYDGFIDVVGKGYYSFDLNGWHFVSLNDNLADVTAGGAQEAWLKADLAKHPNMPLIGIWHQPRYTCPGIGGHGDATQLQPFWADLYDAGADFIFNGHNHFYQRYKPLNKAEPTAAVDTAKGMIEVVAGSYGVTTYPVCNPVDPLIEKTVGDDAGIGVFFLTLGSDGSYSFEYRLENNTVWDSGSGMSHHHS